VQLRRALILFAIVLGLAALAASVSGPQRGTDRREPPRKDGSGREPTVAAQPAASGSVHVRFLAGGRRERRRLDEGRAAVVTVGVPKAGQVELRGLGLSAVAEPVTPARFDILADRPGTYSVEFEPAAGRGAAIGRLIVAPRT
jgi:hypothetical protein